MSVARFGILAAFLFGLMFVMVVQATAAGSDVRIEVPHWAQGTGGSGVQHQPNAPPPLGSQFVLTAALYNAAPQFGKPVGPGIGPRPCRLHLPRADASEW